MRRIPDNRSSRDRTYRIRYVVDSSVSLSRDPINGYIVQPRNVPTGQSYGDVYYIYDIEKIDKELIKKYGDESVVDYYGAINSETRQKNIEDFQNNPNCRFFVGNPQTGGYGITLTAANTVIYYSNGYDLEKRLQSEDRAHRIGQKNIVTYIDFIAPKTVDEKIRKALRKKINIASEILGEKIEEWI